VDEITRTHLNNLHSKDRTLQNDAFSYLMTVTEKPVDWAYDVWNDLVTGLSDKDNRVRAISAQVLCNLAQSDRKQRMLNDFPALLAVTKDERFVTARHCLQALWKVGLAGEEHRQLVMGGLESRYHECITEKNCTLIRYDIIQDLQNLYDAVEDEAIKEKALALIDLEDDGKYRKKYAGVWKDK
jgi:hypothetical protein